MHQGVSNYGGNMKEEKERKETGHKSLPNSKNRINE